MNRALMALAILAFLAVGADCRLRGPTPAEAAHDGSWGSTIGGLLAGPGGAKIGALLAIGLGIVIRSTEKGRMVAKHADEKVQIATDLTDKFAKSLAGIATTQTYRASSDALQKTAAPVQQEPPAN